MQCREFEDWVIANADKLKCPVYLSYGQENIAEEFHKLYPDAMVFPQHRCHSWYIAYGGDIQKLKDEVMGLDTGCSFGNGGSSDPQCEQVIAHNGLMGENASVACGYALQTGKLCICVLGDGSVEEDYVLTSLGFAATHKLPIIFVVEDNGLAILTKTEARRSWDIVDVAKGFGLQVSNTTERDLSLYNGLLKTPCLINVKTTRIKHHVGCGEDK